MSAMWRRLRAKAGSHRFSRLPSQREERLAFEREATRRQRCDGNADAHQELLVAREVDALEVQLLGAPVRRARLADVAGASHCTATVARGSDIPSDQRRGVG